MLRSVIRGELRSKVDRLWDAFWSGGISNPLEVIEQITYLMFIKRLDDLQTLEENKANRTGKPIENPVYAEDDPQELRWSVFTEMSPEAMYQVIADGVFPWLRRLGGEGSTYSHHMKDARFTIPTPNLLTKAVDTLDDLPLDRGDTKGDLYEYMLSKIATAGHNGQFRTPRHIIQLMVEMTNPGPRDDICDPACGTAGFLVAAAEYVQREHKSSLLEHAQREHFHNSMFHGFDFDSTMLRIASMNMLLHGIDEPDIRYRDSLAESAADEAERYSLILANPPFAGSLDYETTAEDLLRVVKTKKTELLFLALFLRLLKPGGRSAVIVPEGVLFGSTKAHIALRKKLVEDQKLDAIVKLPSGVFKPYAGVSTAIVFFTRTNAGGTDNVWFYDVTADGLSLDDKRIPLLPEDKLGARPTASFDESDHARNNLPDVLARWGRRNGTEVERARTEQSFCVSKDDIAAQNYDLSLNRYKERVHEEVKYRPPLNIIADLEHLESEIQSGLSILKKQLT
jgi:type I restriction enzyme M protein